MRTGLFSRRRVGRRFSIFCPGEIRERLARRHDSGLAAAMRRWLILFILVTLGLLAMEEHYSHDRMDVRRQLLTRMVGQMILVGFTGTNRASPGFQRLMDDLESGIVGGVLFLPENIAGKSEMEVMVRELRRCACAVIPFIAVDEEGGHCRALKRGIRI